MKRREFLHFAGASSAYAMMGASVRAASEDEPGMIDMERVRNRNQNRSTVVSANGMVCASQPLAAMVGVDILKSGGNAVDAAICVNAMLGLVEPPSNGLGGDLFAILWLEKDRRLYGLNASGRSPYDWGLKDALDMGLESIPGNSPLAWSVPGCVSGWGALSERFGKKPLADELLFGRLAKGGRVTVDHDGAKLTFEFADGPPPKKKRKGRSRRKPNTLEPV